MTTLVLLKEAAPQFKRSEAAMRFWTSQKDCPLKTAKIGGRVYVTQENIDAVLAAAFSEAS